ncbi:hypothetical protein GCM10007162_00050 [Ignatzschineria ureiclastica]|nr:hypothetical protein GCM10007162_00050 [Ignatzschineria ureiclastica]
MTYDTKNATHSVTAPLNITAGNYTRKTIENLLITIDKSMFMSLFTAILI